MNSCSLNGLRNAWNLRQLESHGLVKEIATGCSEDIYLLDEGACAFLSEW